MINWWNTFFGKEEIDSICEAITNKNISQGKITAQFESLFAEKMKSKYAVTSPNGTTAILLALHAIGVRGGDEVITPVFTAMGTANGVFGLGAKPIFVDTNADNSSICISDIESKITPNTKAILVMHPNGLNCDIEALQSLSEKYALPIVEDSAQAMFSQYQGQNLGTFFAIGTFSFSVAKIISSGQGGISITDDVALYEKMTKMKIQDRDDYDTPSFNMKFTDIQAAMLLPQLMRIDTRIAKVTQVFKRYKDAIGSLEGVRIEPIDLERGNIPLWALVQFEDRERLLEFLIRKGISPVKYPKPLNHAKWFRSSGEFPNADRISNRGLRLPCGPSVSVQDVDLTIEAIREFYS
jgi:perosamine synthetase